ncbi:MAG: diguanylate cyclase [Wenzhouxiangellaceae bacterium]|nr:diguanylate cyclase [Wenzhouxiangellaceae bacterium]
MGGDRVANVNKLFRKRVPPASELADWENEGGGLPADESIGSSRDQASHEIRGPLEINELARVTLDSIADAVISTDADGKVAYMNSTAVEMTGWTLQQAAGRPLAEVFRVIDSKTGRPAADPALRAIAEDHAVTLALDCVLVRRDGSEVEIEDSAAPIHDRQGRLVGAVIIFRDVRFSHAMVDRMLYLARHDLLTGQANRFALEEQFDLARRMASRHHWKIGVLFIDIDRFKFINDWLGHDAGDEVLVTVAQRLADCLRESDTLSRYGGDEFVLLLGEIRQGGDAARVARKLQSALADPELIAGHAINLSLSIGSSVYPDDGADLRTLVQKADQAMLQTKIATRCTGTHANELR